MKSVMRPYIDQCQDLPERYRRLRAEVRRVDIADHGPR